MDEYVKHPGYNDGNQTYFVMTLLNREWWKVINSTNMIKN